MGHLFVLSWHALPIKVGVVCKESCTPFPPPHLCTISYIKLQGGNSWGGGGAVAPQLLVFGGFSHTTDRKVPSEVVLLGSFMSVIYGNVR